MALRQNHSIDELNSWFELNLNIHKNIRKEKKKLSLFMLTEYYLIASTVLSNTM